MRNRSGRFLLASDSLRLPLVDCKRGLSLRCRPGQQRTGNREPLRYIGGMPDTISAFEFLAKPPITDVPPVCVLFGEEPLLKREALDRIRSAVLPEEDAELSLTKFDGREVELCEVLDELATVSMFGGGRPMVVVEEADE